jgi:hypothetical protein
MQQLHIPNQAQIPVTGADIKTKWHWSIAKDVTDRSTDLTPTLERRSQLLRGASQDAVPEII